MPDTPLVLHDFFTFPDGGGRVALTLAQGLAAELWGGEVNVRNCPQDFFDGELPQSLQALSRSPVWLRPSRTAQFWWAFSRFPKSSPAWTVFSGSLSLLAHQRIQGRKILYCHTPPRMLYDQRRNMLADNPAWRRPGLLLLMAMYRKAYRRAVRSMDCVVANSVYVKERIRYYLGLESTVIYPPVETDRFQWLGQEDFYLSTARLDSLKRVDLVVRAFAKMPDKKLVIVSGGAQENEVRRLADNAHNIHVLGWVSEATLRRLMGTCMATIYIPRDEDFGMSPVEAMAAGKPVIGVQEGGLLETIGQQQIYGDKLDGPGFEISNGQSQVIPKRNHKETWCSGSGFIETPYGILLCSNPEVSDLVQGVRHLTPAKAREKRESCERKATGFARNIFLERMKRVTDGSIE